MRYWGVIIKYIPPTEPAGGCWSGGGAIGTGSEACAGHQRHWQARGRGGTFCSLNSPPNREGAFVRWSGCHTAVRDVLSCFFLSCEFPVLFWKVTLLSFQVTCLSSCGTGLASPLIPDCFHLCHLSSCVHNLCLPLSSLPEYFVRHCPCTSSLPSKSCQCHAKFQVCSRFSVCLWERVIFCL